MLTLGLTVLGVTDMRRAMIFWSLALGYDIVEGGDDSSWTELGPADEEPLLALQFSDEPPQDHPRVHIDLDVPSAEEQSAEVARLVSLGARQVDWDSYPEDPDFVVLADTEGNIFCVVNTGHTHPAD
ncbi:MAG TPA: VOC family protein [Streptosporangiaceae bacterium]|nr:VOC family protein [Streptosporangiaceae bacterium]